MCIRDWTEIIDYLIERVIFTFHVGVTNTLAKNVLVKGASKITLEQFIVINGLCDDATNKLEVTQMIGITMRECVDHVRNSITR